MIPKAIGVLTIIGMILSSYLFIDAKYADSADLIQYQALTNEKFKKIQLKELRREIRRIDYLIAKNRASELDIQYKKELMLDYEELKND